MKTIISASFTALLALAILTTAPPGWSADLDAGQFKRFERGSPGGPQRDDFGEILEQFNLPYANNAGLAWDGEFIWGVTRANGRRLYKMNPENFEVIEDYAIDQTDAIGMTYDHVDGVFWVCEHRANNQNSVAFLYDTNGDQVGEIELPRLGHHGLAFDGEFFYANSENANQNQMIYKMRRNGEVVAEAGNVVAEINHGRAISLEWVGQHQEGHFWVMSVNYISQLAIDFENGEVEVIREFQSQQSDYPHQGLAHDGFNLWAGGSWRETRGFVYDDGFAETYGELGLEQELLEFGPLPTEESSEIVLSISNLAEDEDELHLLFYTLTDLGGDPDWLDFEVDGGEVEARQTVEVTITANAEGLELGEYERVIRLETNDPDYLEIDLPVHVFVVEGFGSLRGTVTRLENGDPVSGATVTVGNFGFQTVSGDDGGYDFGEIPAWTYDFMVIKEDYLPLSELEVEIEVGEDVELDFALRHAELILNPDAIDNSLQVDDELEIRQNLRNSGNGPLTWSVERVFPEEMMVDPWEHRWRLDAAEVVNNTYLNAIAFADDRFFIAARVRDSDNLIYILNRDGELIGEFPQFTDSQYGFRGLTWDGSLLWGYDDGNILGFDLNGDLTRSIESPVEARAIAWDAERNIFWMCDLTSDIYGVSLGGELAVTIERPEQSLYPYGIEIYPEDEDGDMLYMFCGHRDFSQQIWKLDLQSGEASFVAEPDIAGQAGGLAITGTWDPYNWSLIGLTRGNPDAIEIFQLGSRTQWLAVDPLDGVIEANQSAELSIILNSDGLPIDVDFSADLEFTHDGVDGVSLLPITLRVTDVGGVTQRNVPLRLGWNMISINVEPEDVDVRVMMEALVAEDLLIIMKDGQGRFYNPEFDFNNIPFWNTADGYQVKVANECNLFAAGEVIAWNEPLALSEGWNMIAYYPHQRINAVTALSAVVDNLIIAKDGLGHFYSPAFQYNGIGEMREGWGYQLKMEADDELIYRLEEVAVANETPQTLTRHFSAPFSTSENMSVLALGDKAMIVGWELGVFSSNDLLVGSGVFGVDGRCGVAVWGDDPTTDEIDGALEGERLTIRRWDGVEDSPASFEEIMGEASYRKDDLLVIEMTEMTTTPGEFGIISSHPNPFNASTRIAYNVPEDSRVVFRAFDLAGREAMLIQDEMKMAGRGEIVWDASELPAGIYICRMETGVATSSIKLVLLK